MFQNHLIILECLMELNEYIELIRKEFSQSTYYKNEKDRDDSIFVNWKSRVPMTKEEIEKGIALGLEICEQQRGNDRERN